MTLTELIVKVKEKNLSKEQLELYQDEMSQVFADMMIELAEIEKKKAIYFDVVKQEKPEFSDVSIKRMWSAREEGLREIVLKRYTVATKELINSLKSRVYRLIY